MTKRSRYKIACAGFVTCLVLVMWGFGCGGSVGKNSSAVCTNADSSIVVCRATPDCPTGLPGPSLVGVPCAQGGFYCMDSTEVTRSQYSKFATTAPVAAPCDCGWKVGYAPNAACENDPGVAKQDSHPQACVDWCDAHGFCAWAGKRLCTGTWSSKGKDPAQDEWFNACSAGGTKTYCFGSTWDPIACNTAARSPSNPTTEPVGSLTTCEGGFPKLFDLTGNVAEWSGACDGVSGIDGKCAVRGGTYAVSDFEATCASAPPEARDVTSKYFGFRCCY